MKDAENLKREAYEETRRRQMAERDLAEANKVADEAERSHQREARRRKEVEEMLARERAEMDRDRRDLDAMLDQIRKANDRSAQLEVQIASSERAMSELEARLHESYTILHSLRSRGATAGGEEEEEEEEGGSCRRFSYSELEEATNHFDESLRIDDNDGGRGKVYRGRLRSNGMDVAVKVLRPEDLLLSRVRSGGLLVQVVGVCPEARAVVYELLPGARTLDDRLATLPWHVRCAVAHRTCQALASLHDDGTVHGDVSPRNILLFPVLLDDGSSSASWSSKLGGLGTRRPLVEERGNNVAYASPRYLATGHPTPRCDLYSLGVVLLQLVTGKPAFLARKAAHDAATAATEWRDVVHPGWPVDRAREVALVALKCCDDDAQNKHQSLLEEAMSALQDAISAAPGRSPSAISDADGAPSYFLCPVLKELMRDPHIAADGFSYEAQAIREWIHSGHDTSPMTNLKLPTRNLTPNHALRSAIQQWRQRCQPAPQLDHS